MKNLLRKTTIFVIAFCVLAVAAVSEAAWRLDEDPNLPELLHFRMASDDWQVAPEGEPPTRDGLDKLHESGSAQLTADGFAKLYSTISAVAPGLPIYVVDLRQESHGFADGIPVSWHENHNQANMGKTVDEIKADESLRLSELVGKTTTFVPKGDSDKAAFGEITLTPKSVKDEEETVVPMGFRYIRIYATDKTWPSNESIEAFLDFVNALPQDAWLHFHCHAGHGRTTSFMAMYDMIRNPDVPFEDIIKRQYLIGGTDLTALKKSAKKNEMINHRVEVLENFSRYIKAKQAGATTLRWSEWTEQEAK